MITDNQLTILWRILDGQKYIVLRNYESLTAQLNSGKDVDLLCESKEQVVSILEAHSLSTRDDSYSYFTDILGQRILVDVREIGDDYYDSKWEAEMISNRRKFSDFYIADYDDYQYSLLYHSLIHKSEIGEKYLAQFKEIFGTIDKNRLIKCLADYMREKKFKASIPLDSGVEFNYENYSLLISCL